MKPILLAALLAAPFTPALHAAETPASSPALAERHETPGQREARMKWWTEARFGMFIHWSPSSVGGTEIGWGRKGNRPKEFGGNRSGPDTVSVDPVYDTYFKRFNPVAYDAKEWVELAKDAGMKYMVFTSKHHEGFAMWPSKVRPDFTIAATPWKGGKGDVLKELSDACHAAGMRLGWYYSPRDWTHPDYGVGDNAKYEADMKTHITEILSNYGKVDVIWWDSFGQGDSITYWHADKFLDLVRKLQPGIIINNRCSFYIESDRKGMEGDFDTPEQVIGKYQVDRPWESCITLVGRHWSFQPGGAMMSFDSVIETLVSCATGDGNLLLNVGPMADGRIEPRQADLLREVGKWMEKNGDTIYATHGGPFRNGRWGGATFKDNTIYLHVLSAAPDTLCLPALKGALVSARNLTGGPVQATLGKDGRIVVTIPKEGRTKPDTIVALTLDRPVERVAGEVELANAATLGLRPLDMRDATWTASSIEERWSGEKDALLKGGAQGPFAFHTKDETNPSLTIDLKKVKHIDAVEIQNRQDMKQERARGLTLEVSEDGSTWTKVWQADTVESEWIAVPVQHVAGADVKGTSARYLRLSIPSQTPTALHLKEVKV